MQPIRKMKEALGLGPVTGFYSYAPTGYSPKLSQLDRQTFLASICTWRRHRFGPLCLFASYEGRQDIGDMDQLGFLVDDSQTLIHTDFDGINTQVFWAASKIIAYGMVEVPAVSIDMDAIVHANFWRWKKANFMPLYAEPSSWPCYQCPGIYSKNVLYPAEVAKRKLGKNDLFLSEAWFDKQRREEFNGSTPYNCGVLGLFSQRAKQEYSETALRFMRMYSRYDRPAYYTDPTKPKGSTHFAEMMFAEQRLLSILARVQKYSILPIAKFAPEKMSVCDNPYVTHLWIAKREMCQPSIMAYQAYLSHLVFDFALPLMGEPDGDAALELAHRWRLFNVVLYSVHTRSFRFVFYCPFADEKSPYFPSSGEEVVYHHKTITVASRTSY